MRHPERTVRNAVPAPGGGAREVWRFPPHRQDTLGTAGCIHEGLFIEVSKGLLDEDRLQRLVEMQGPLQGPGDMAILTYHDGHTYDGLSYYGAW